MNNDMLPQRKFIICSADDRLKDQIEAIFRARPMPPHEVQLAGDIPDFVRRCGQEFGSFGLVDMTSARVPVPDKIDAVHDFYLSGKEACLMAMGDDCDIAKSCLLKLGFRGVIHASDLSKIGPLAKRYWDSVCWPPQNITELVISNLPWPAIE